MPGDNTTTGNAQPSGSQVGDAKPKGNFGRLIPGNRKQEELLSFRLAKDQADLYLRTREHIAEVVGMEYGKNMRNLVRHGKEATFKAPVRPAADAIEKEPGLLEEWKLESAAFRKDVKEYDDQKAKVYTIVFGYCAPEVKSKLMNDSDFEELETNCDVVGLLNKLKAIAFKTDGGQYQPLILAETLRRLYGIRQGSKESLNHYYKRFKSLLDVAEVHWGGSIIPAEYNQATPKNKQKANQRLLAMIFLDGADPIRYGRLKDNLHKHFHYLLL